MNKRNFEVGLVEKFVMKVDLLSAQREGSGGDGGWQPETLDDLLP